MLFKKFNASDVSSAGPVKTSVTRNVRASLIETYPFLEETGLIDLFVPKKAVLNIAKCQGHIQVLLKDGEPLFFKTRDGPWCPTLRLVHQYPGMMKKLRVDTGAIKFVLAGADIMCPGLTSAGATIHDEGEKGEPVAIFAQDKENAMAVGILLMSTEEIRLCICMVIVHRGLVVSMRRCLQHLQPRAINAEQGVVCTRTSILSFNVICLNLLLLVYDRVMGVHGLWPLLEPVGRRINIRALSGKRLAIDASIWLFQFLKVMRDDDGEFIKNGHLLGFFRRICRLLFNKIRPVFVFDGATPTLKRLTVAARRRRREIEGAALRKTAEKLLMSKLKARLVEEEKARRAVQRSPRPVGALSLSAAAAASQGAAGTQQGCTGYHPALPRSSQGEKLVGLGAVAGKTRGGQVRNDGCGTRGDDTLQGNLEDGEVLEAHLSQPVAEPLSRVGGQDSAKHCHVPSRVDAIAPGHSVCKTLSEASDSSDAESSGRDSDVDIDAIVDAQGDRVDAELIGALPPSLQMEVVTRLRDRQLVANRTTFQDPALCPQGFSGVQMRSYLKRTDLRRQVDLIRDRMNEEAGYGVRGAAARPIASQAGRAFILRDDAEGVFSLYSRSPPPPGQEVRKIAAPLPQLRRGKLGDWNRKIMKHAMTGRMPRGQLDDVAALTIAPGLASLPAHLSRSAGEVAAAPAIAAAEDREPSAAPLGAADEAELLLHVSLTAEELRDSLDGLSGAVGQAESGHAGESSEEGAGSMEWEDAGDNSMEGSSLQRRERSGAATEGVAAPSANAHWRERAAFRQQYWSRLHGFRFGRKLGEWSKGDDGPGGVPGLDDSLAPAAPTAPEEEAVMQRAILASLSTAPHGTAALPLDLTEHGGTMSTRRYALGFQTDGASMSAPAVNTSSPASPAGVESVANSGSLEWEAEETDLSHLAAATLAQGPAQRHEHREGTRPRDGTVEHGPVLGAHLQPEEGGDLVSGISRSAVSSALGNSGSIHCASKKRSHVTAPSVSPAGREQDDEMLCRVPLRASSRAEASASLSAQIQHLQHGDNSSLASGAPSAGVVGAPSSLVEQVNAVSRSALDKELGCSSCEASLADAHGTTCSVPRRSGSHPSSAGGYQADVCSSVVTSADVAAVRTRGPAPGTAALARSLSSSPRLAGLGARLTFTPHGKSEVLVPGSDGDKAVDLVSTGSPGELHGSIRPPPIQNLLPTAVNHRSALSTEASVLELDVGGEAGRHVIGGEQPDAVAPADNVDESDIDYEELLDADDDMLAMLPGDVQTAVAMLREAHRVENDAADTAPARSTGSGMISGILGGDDAGPAVVHVAPDPAKHAAAAVNSRGESSRGGAAAQQGRRSEAGRQTGSTVKASGAEMEAIAPQVPRPEVDLDEALREVMGETKTLKRNFQKQAGQQDVPTDQMFRDCQELLQHFGLPYIVAPAEAEAQCAWLEGAGLVDGVVTEDNDVLLFGGTNVYRHFFEDRQYCEAYKAADIEAELGLNRDRLAMLALLLGSDYTEGIAGIGIVNAMETLSAFPSVEALKHFREWIESPDIEQFEAINKRAKVLNRKGQGLASADDRAASADSPAVFSYKTNHRVMSKNWQLPSKFPDPAVLKAYSKPRVDEGTDKFEFRTPDIEILRPYCQRYFNWTQDQVDTLLLPVVQAYQQRQTQMQLDTFVTITHRFAKIRSKRLQVAVAGVSGTPLREELKATSDEAPSGEKTALNKGSEDRPRSRHKRVSNKHGASCEVAALAPKRRNVATTGRTQMKEGTLVARDRVGFAARDVQSDHEIDRVGSDPDPVMVENGTGAIPGAPLKEAEEDYWEHEGMDAVREEHDAFVF